MELNEFDHKPIIGAGDSPLRLDYLFCFLVVISKLKDNKCYNDGYRTRYALNAMNQNIGLVLLAIQDEVNGSIEQTLNILVLRIFQEKGQIIYILILEPVFAVVSGAIYYRLYLIFLECLPRFCHLFPRNVNSLYYLTAFSLELLHLQLMPSCCSNIKLNLTIFLLLFNLRILHFFKRL